MLNRTNRKLSAKNFGLNLGTRMLAVKAGVNMSKLTHQAAGPLESARVGARDGRDSVWLDAIVTRSYPAIPIRTASITGSSPAPSSSDYRRQGAGSVGQIAVLASLRSVRLLHAGASCRGFCHPQPMPRFPIGPVAVGRQVTANQQLLSRQVPDATP